MTVSRYWSVLWLVGWDLTIFSAQTCQRVRNLAAEGIGSGPGKGREGVFYRLVRDVRARCWTTPSTRTRRGRAVSDFTPSVESGEAAGDGPPVMLGDIK